jgi:hypothetical protein
MDERGDARGDAVKLRVPIDIFSIFSCTYRGPHLSGNELGGVNGTVLRERRACGFAGTGLRTVSFGNYIR